MPQHKFLVEFLQEKQEPFSLETYLAERGCRTPSRISKVSALFGLNKGSRRPSVRHCSDVFKQVFSILEVNRNKRISNPGNAERDQRESSETYTTTTMSISCSESTTDIQDSLCSESDLEDTHCSEVDDACQFTKEGNADQGSVEDSKQLSPVSVLELADSDYGSPVHYKQCNFNLIQEASTPRRRPELPNRVQGVQKHQPHISDSYSQYNINKTILRQSKRLLMDCTREVVESHKKKDKKREHLNQILGTDQLWKLVCENVWQWSQDLIDETNTSSLVCSDFYATSEEWNGGPEQQKMEISIEMGDAILDQIIHEIVQN